MSYSMDIDKTNYPIRHTQLESMIRMHSRNRYSGSRMTLIIVRKAVDASSGIQLRLGKSDVFEPA